MSVYLDVSRAAVDARKAIVLRWRSAREILTEQGADAATLDAVQSVLGEVGLPQQRPLGRNGGRIPYVRVLIDRWGADITGSWVAG